MGPEQLARLLSGDQAKAAPWVEAAAQAGLSAAQVRYGRLLLEGAGVTKDQTAAYGWFLHAALSGDGEGQKHGRPLLRERLGASRSIRRRPPCGSNAPAEQDHAWARYNLGHLYLDGLGVARDRDRALRPLQPGGGRRARQGHEPPGPLLRGRLGARRRTPPPPATGTDARRKAAIFADSTTTPPS